ncbi:hypothetical protein ACN27J_18955 [Solwaraspora sp. WMMB762]|uniref:hypothetical protein n=1 Tax=Solwaraspora sp. WMMB762 TaxID=3404120 RepID=UPI003B92F22D
MPDGEVERRAQGGAQVPHRRRGLWQPSGVGDLGDLVEHGAQQSGVEVGEAVRAEVRDQDPFDIAGVVQPGGCSDPDVLVEPMPQPPFDGPAVGGALLLGRGQPLVPCPACRRLGRVAASADAFGPAEHVAGAAVEVPAAMATITQTRAAPFQPPATGVPTPAPLEDHTRRRHDQTSFLTKLTLSTDADLQSVRVG